MVVVRQIGAAGTRLQPGDALQRLLHLVHRRARAAGDLRDAPLAERVHELVDDAVFQSVLLAQPLELEQQAFAQIPRADARRVESLNHLQHLDDLIRQAYRWRRQLLHGDLQIAVLINVADEHFRDRPLVLRQSGLANLLQQHFLQRGSGHQGIEHELPLLFVLGGGPHRQVGLGKMIAPFLVELHQALKLRLKVIHRLAGALLGGGIKVQIRGRFGRISRVGRLLGLATVFLLLIRFRRGRFFQHRILLQLLFDQRFEFQRGRLQEGQRLLQLRRQHQRLRQTLRQM